MTVWFKNISFVTVRLKFQIMKKLIYLHRLPVSKVGQKYNTVDIKMSTVIKMQTQKILNIKKKQ